MYVGRSIIRSLCPPVTLVSSFATADLRLPLLRRRIAWCHAFVAVCTLHLLHWIVV